MLQPALSLRVLNSSENVEKAHLGPREPHQPPNLDLSDMSDLLEHDLFTLTRPGKMGVGNTASALNIAGTNSGRFLL